VVNPVLAEVVRSGFTESVHRGAVAVMPHECAILVADFWTRHNLFQSRQDALAAVERLKAALH